MGRFRQYFVGAGFGVTLVLYLIAAYGAAQVGLGLWDRTSSGYQRAQAEQATLAGGLDASFDAVTDDSQSGPLDATLRNTEQRRLNRVSSPGQPARKIRQRAGGG